MTSRTTKPKSVRIKRSTLAKIENEIRALKALVSDKKTKE
jgi:hypothetical protein